MRDKRNYRAANGRAQVSVFTVVRLTTTDRKTVAGGGLAPSLHREGQIAPVTPPLAAAAPRATNP